MDNGATPLFIACGKGHLEVVHALIQAGADLSQARYDGATPLYTACQKGHLEVVHALIQAGADLNQGDRGS
jgi:ankyrin repeat protein